MLSYEGIDEATLIHALYQSAHVFVGTFAGNISAEYERRGGVTLEDVRADLATCQKEIAEGRLRIDYYKGRPLKITLNTILKQFDEWFYDRDAGRGHRRACHSGTL